MASRVGGLSRLDTDWVSGVGMSEDWLLVRGATPTAGGSFVDVYKRSGMDWEKKGRLSAPTESGAVASDVGNSFGRAIAVWGDTALIGAPGADGGDGRVYGYRLDRSSGSWRLETTIDPSDLGGSRSEFGQAVDIYDDVAIIGAPKYSRGSDAGAGAAYLYTRSSDGTWTKKRDLWPTSAVSGAYGTSVAISRSTAVVGAPVDSWKGGRVVVFDKAGADWSSVSNVTLVPRLASANFGRNVDCAEGLIAVAQPGNASWSLNGMPRGSVASYRRLDNGEWADVTVPDVEDWGSGVAIALADNTLYVTQLSSTVSHIIYAYGYDTAKCSWTRIDVLGVPGDKGGLALAASGDTLVGCGNRMASDGATDIQVYAPYSTPEGTPLVTDAARGLCWNDSLKTASLEITEDTRQGRTTVAPGGAFTFTPTAGFTGTHSFTYRYDSVAHPYSPEVGVRIKVLPKPATPDALADIEPLRRTATTSAPDLLCEEFGASVAVWNDTALIGAPGEFYVTDGRAFVIGRRLDTGAWGPPTELPRPPLDRSHDSSGIAPFGGDRFGESVAISGDIAVVGAPRATGEVQVSGCAYVYTRIGSSWKYSARLEALDAGPLDEFGRAVQISGNTIAVGARRFVDGATGEGSIYVFQRNGDTWNQQAVIHHPLEDSYKPGGRFAESFALWGDTILASHQESDGTRFVTEYTRSGWNWSPSDTIVAPAVAGRSFGDSIALYGGNAVIGAPDKMQGNKRLGAVYFYKREGKHWRSDGRAVGSASNPDSRFGEHVALWDTCALVSAPFTKKNSSAKAGACYLFNRRADVWVCDSSSLGDSYTPADNAALGSAIAISRGTAVAAELPSPSTSSSQCVSLYRMYSTTQGTDLVVSQASEGLLSNDSGSGRPGTLVASPSPARDDLTIGANGTFIAQALRIGHIEFGYEATNRYDGRSTLSSAMAHVAPAIPAVAVPDGYVTPHAKLADDGFDMWRGGYGRAVAMVDDLLVIGSGSEDIKGCVSVYEKGNSGEWNLTRTLASVNATGEFGAAVAIDDADKGGGKILYVGAPGESDEVGAVYAYRLEAREWWRHPMKLLRSPAWTTVTDSRSGIGVKGDRFGAAIAADSRDVYVGAPGVRDSAGAVSKFTSFVSVSRGGTEWYAEEVKLGESFTKAANGFGASLDYDGKRLAVGAPAGTSPFVATFRSDRADALEYKQTGQPSFGFSVALGPRGMLAVGEPARSKNSGVVHVYEADGTRSGAPSLRYAKQLVPSQKVEDCFFGWSLSFSRAPRWKLEGADSSTSSLLVGAPGERNFAGAAYLFRWKSERAVDAALTTRIVAPDGQVADFFGTSIALDEDEVIVGAPCGEGWTPATGCVYTFNRYSTTKNRVLRVTRARGVLANDSAISGEPMIAECVSPPKHGAVVVRPDGSFDYTPATDFVGIDSFTYSVGCGGTSCESSVSIEVLPGVNATKSPQTTPSGQPTQSNLSSSTPPSVTLLDSMLGLLGVVE